MGGLVLKPTINPSRLKHVVTGAILVGAVFTFSTGYSPAKQVFSPLSPKVAASNQIPIVLAATKLSSTERKDMRRMTKELKKATNNLKKRTRKLKRLRIKYNIK